MLKRKSNANGGIKRYVYLKRKTPLKRSRAPKKEDTALKKFYDDAMNNSTYKCEECGENVYSISYIFRKSTVAHLLPKKIFKSVKAHIKNKICLGGTCGCHSKYDKSWASAIKMKIWPVVENILVNILIPLLPPDEYSKLPKFLKNIMLPEELINTLVTVTDTSNYRNEYSKDEDTPEFKAVLFEISNYPCFWVRSVKTGKEYELYRMQIKELCETT